MKRNAVQTYRQISISGLYLRLAVSIFWVLKNIANSHEKKELIFSLWKYQNAKKF